MRKRINKCIFVLFFIIMISISIKIYGFTCNYEYMYKQNDRCDKSQCEQFANDLKEAAAGSYTYKEFLDKIGMTDEKYIAVLNKVIDAMNYYENNGDNEDESGGGTSFTINIDNINALYNQLKDKKDKDDVKIDDSIINSHTVEAKELIDESKGGTIQLGRDLLALSNEAKTYMSSDIDYESANTEQLSEHKEKGNQIIQKAEKMKNESYDKLSQKGQEVLNGIISSVKYNQKATQTIIDEKGGGSSSSGQGGYISGEGSKNPVISSINPADYKPSELTAENAGGLTTVGGKILGMVNTLGVVISVIVLTLIGIKYMIGSVEEKAQYKQTMVPYVIGAVLLVSGTTVVNVLYQLGKSIW